MPAAGTTTIMMDSSIAADEYFDPPPRLFERLRQIAGYTWDDSKPPFHSTYDVWHVFGTRFVSPFSPPSSSHHASSPGSAAARLQSGRPSPSELHTSIIGTPSGLHSDVSSERSATSPPALSMSHSQAQPEISYVEEPVVARLSFHVLREERSFHITKNIISSADPKGEHIVKPLELIRLPPAAGDRGPIIMSIYQHPGYNCLLRLIDIGPAFYWSRKEGDRYVADRRDASRLDPPISLQYFLDFAIGAAECLEILHHGQGIIHGEIRADAFHFNLETNRVKLVSFGSGLRSFENGLTSTGWSTLSKELGARNKLLYISPEQTGRMPAEPDSRTDIYSLGVLFWTLLTQQPVFEGETPLDIVQGVLGRRIPSVSAIRLDIPDVIGRIIQKCTAKNVAERYHSASGLRHDLVQVQKFLSDGDVLALKEWKIGSKDVSSFFMLPTMMIGRQKERNDLVKVIERVAKSHALSQRAAGNRFSDGSSLSNEVLEGADVSSEGASSVDGNNRRSGSFTHTATSDPRQSRGSFQPSVLSDTHTISGETISSTGSGLTARHPRQWERHQSVSIETRSMVDGVAPDGTSSGNRHSTAVESSSSSLSRQLGSAKFRRRGHCEIVMIEGAGGLGKSFLVQSVLAEARRRGYCATAKFDTARRTAFGPLLKLLSSLFKQVWGERNTETPFHQQLKHYVRPVWPMLHKILGLPEFLLGPVESNVVARSISVIHPPGHSSRSLRRRASFSGSNPQSPSPLNRNSSVSSNHHSIASQPSQDFLRGGTSTKTMRLMNTFLDVLRMFTTHKFICFCLDDLHFADDESLELITQIIAARMKMVVIITYRPDEMSPEKVQSIIHPPDSEEYVRPGSGPTITRITLSPLSEDDIIQYVSTTLCRPMEEVLPLALVIQSKTAGNPFYMREMLSACYRKRCVWYDYKDSQWNFDLDRLFEQFQGEKDYDILDTGFITRRLSELPSSSRAILAWAALLGRSFSFELICHLLGGEYHYVDESCPQPHHEHYHTSYSQQDAIAGLQAAIQAYILVPSETDDRFRFAHDRYIQASASLKECNARKMHFVIAQTLLKYYPSEPRIMDSTASHICESVEIIQKKVPHRQPFRKLLFDCAQNATENGARPTAAKYYSTAVALLQPDPWADGLEDVSYDETIQLYLRAAECYLFMGNNSAANSLLSTVFTSARTALDKAPAYVLQSRIYAQNGDARGALLSLKDCLSALGVSFDEEPTFEKCDAEFERLSIKIQTMDRSEILAPNIVADTTLPSIGAVLAETVSAAWWSDSLRFYHLTMVMVEMHLRCGAFPQSGMAFLHMGIIALSRFNMIHFATDLSSICLELLDRFRDPFSMAKGYMIFGHFISHVQYPLPVSLSYLEGAMDFAAASGDRISTILSYGLSAQLKFFASENLFDLEAFCQYSCEGIPNWHLDTRGGTLLVSVRQICRALQGKTSTKNPLEIMTDEQHSTTSYKAWLGESIRNGNRSIYNYETMEIVPLFLYGHYDRAVELGEATAANLDLLWSSRNTRLLLLFYGLALAGRVLRQIEDPIRQGEDFAMRKQDTIKKLQDVNKKITDWSVVTDINYLSWTRLLDAKIAELSCDHGHAIRLYEESLDHAAEHDFIFEEALGNYLMAGLFIRRGARRSARAALRDALGLYRQFGAVGVADYIEEEHNLLLHGPTRNPRTVDAGVQTDFAPDADTVQFRNMDTEDVSDIQENSHEAIAEMKDNRIGAWRGSMHNMQAEAGAGLPALDMIDLHAILVSSQVISSVLRVEELLKTMCDVILQTCGGSATLAAIVVREQGSKDLKDKDLIKDAKSLCIAASGDPEKGALAHLPGLPLEGTSLVADNIILYCARFREVVFIPDVLGDERFGNVCEPWLQRNPMSKAVIAIPICHASKSVLGVLYLEGEPGSFTDRNVTVLQLLVNQIGISYSNALAMKAIEKVSAENVSIVDLQKRALAQAKDAETKAKNAEAEAKRNVKLAEEAARAKSIFLANVSHELRTPLNGVIGNSELLRDSNLNKEQLEMADSIRVSADLLLTVINDILDFSRMEADKMKLYIIAFNPEEMVREVVRAVSYSNRQKTSKKNVKIIQDINLPSMLVFGDPIRLHQVLGNLIGNSLKFTEDGSITIGARVDSETKEKVTLTFWVKDTGIGIPPKQLAKLFQPFSQADTSTARKYGGSGLGLSICKSLIETMMKGKIQLESEENVGTTAWFTVSFDKPKADVSAGDAQTKSPPPIDRYSAHPTPREKSPNPYLDLTQVPKEQLRVCIAEDNPINQKIAIQYVQRLGYNKVDAYENGQKAVEGLRQKARDGQPYHIILMDVQMPILDGYEATKLIRKDPIDAVRKVLVIAMTASAIQGDREKCLAAGMNDYLAKPVRSEVLKRKLDAYVNPQGRDNITPSPPTAPDTSKFTSAANSNGVGNNNSLPLPVPHAGSLPIRDNPAYSSRLGAGSLTPSRTSSDSQSVDVSIGESTGSGGVALTPTPSLGASATPTPPKRQPRKLTKSRNNSDAAIEKPKALLTKKGPERRTSTLSLVDGEGNTGANGGASIDNKRASFVSHSSGSKDRLTP